VLPDAYESSDDEHDVDNDGASDEEESEVQHDEAQEDEVDEGGGDSRADMVRYLTVTLLFLNGYLIVTLLLLIFSSKFWCVLVLAVYTDITHCVLCTVY
jgi:hypothetical protein